MAQAGAIETLATGYGLIEGPRVDAQGQLYFSDVQRGGVYRRAPDGRIETVVPRRRGVGGIALHADGGLVISGRNVCHVREGATRVLFDLEDAGGFNDLFTDARGRILVGCLRVDPFGDPERGRPGELYRIDAEAKATALYGDVQLTNGIGFSPDGGRLYHSDTTRNQVIVHEVADDGSCHGRRVFARSPRGLPDGLAVDEAGGVWIAAYGGGCVVRFAPDGRVDGEMDVPARSVTSLCFGGADRRDLYVVSADNTEDAAAGGSIFRTRVDVAGLQAPPARI